MNAKEKLNRLKKTVSRLDEQREAANELWSVRRSSLARRNLTLPKDMTANKRGSVPNDML